MPTVKRRLAEGRYDCVVIGAAVHHATGIRVRELPIKIEDLLR